MPGAAIYFLCGAVLWFLLFEWLRHRSWSLHRASGFAPGTQGLALAGSIGTFLLAVTAAAFLFGERSSAKSGSNSVNQTTVTAHTIQTPSGEITFKETLHPGQREFKDKVTPLTSDELLALKRDSERIPVFIEAYVASRDRTGDVLEDLDKAFAVWLNSGKPDTFPMETVIRIVGCGLGSRAIEKFELRWATVTDAHGSDIALVGDEPPVRSFPFTSVQYRIEDGKTNFVVALYRTLEHLVETASK